MKKTNFSKYLSFVLCFVLVAAIALLTVGCGDNNTSTPSLSAQSGSNASSENGTIVGEGKTQFGLEITFQDGSTKSYTVKTDKTTVGEALTELKLISGTVGDYGLMIETVDGQTVTYETDKKYWAFYINGAYANSGVDTTEIEADAVYSLKVEG